MVLVLFCRGFPGHSRSQRLAAAEDLSGDPFDIPDAEFVGNGGIDAQGPHADETVAPVLFEKQRYPL